MLRLLLLLALLAPACARDIFVADAREPDVTPREIADYCEAHGMPRGVLFAVSPPGCTTSAWRRITLDYRGKGNARVHLMRMSRPPFLVNRPPDIEAALDHASACFGFVTASDSGPTIRLKALVAGLLATRGNGLVYDSRFAAPLPVAVWDHQIQGEDFEFPMAVERAVLRCYSVPASPVETVSFMWIPTSIGAVAFDERTLVQIVQTRELPAGSVESGRITTAGAVYRVFDMEKEWGASGHASPIATSYALMNYERGGLAVPADRMHGPIEVGDLAVQLVPPGAAAGSLPSLIVESGESIPAGGPNAYIWLGPGAGRDTARMPLLAIAREALRGPYDRRENAIRAIWRIPGAEAVDLLAEISRSGGGEHLRTLALKGLAQRDDGHAALVELARGGRGHEAPEAVQVLASLKRADTPRLLLETATTDTVSIEARREALMRLRTRVRPEHVPVLRNLLASPEPVVRLLSADLILRVGPSPEARAVLMDEIRSAVPDFDLVVPLLTRHQITEAAPVLAARYASAPLPVRPRIANALAVLAPSAIVTDAGVQLPVVPQRPPQAPEPALPSAPAPPPLATAALSANPHVKQLASVLAAPITVAAAAPVNLAPLQVVALLTGRGLAVGLATMQAGPQATPAQWDTLALKASDTRAPLASITQATVPAATGGPARVAYAITCLSPGDQKALEAAAWLAALIAEKCEGSIHDAAGRTWNAAEWRSRVCE